MQSDRRNNNPDHEALLLDSIERTERLGTLRALSRGSQSDTRRVGSHPGPGAIELQPFTGG